VVEVEPQAAPVAHGSSVRLVPVQLLPGAALGEQVDSDHGHGQPGGVEANATLGSYPRLVSLPERCDRRLQAWCRIQPKALPATVPLAMAV
jgi:hypothetical protein